MGNKTDDNRQLLALVDQHQWQHISAPEWTLLRETFPHIGENALRKKLLALNLKLAQPFRGVDQHSLEGLEETLTALAHLYTRQPKLARTLVIAAKDKARFAARNPKVAEATRALKLEMVDWMLIWLGDPAIFTTWVALRKAQLARTLQ